MQLVQTLRPTLVAAVAAVFSLGGNPTVVTAEAPVSSKPLNFRKAKRVMARVYASHRKTFYCACRYDERKRVNHASCGYKPLRPGRRANRVEWEHVVPAEAFGRSFVEWRVGHALCVDRRGRPFKGRNCARRANPLFREMEGNPYNLVPAIGEINARRSNFSMARIPGEARRFGSCDTEIANRKIEPRPAIRGDIARIYLYMHATYPGRGVVSRKNRRLYDAWSRADPPDRWECERARRIEASTGIVNSRLKRACARRP